MRHLTVATHHLFEGGGLKLSGLTRWPPAEYAGSGNQGHEHVHLMTAALAVSDQKNSAVAFVLTELGHRDSEAVMVSHVVLHLYHLTPRSWIGNLGSLRRLGLVARSLRSH